MLTLPHDLNALILGNKRLLLGRLFAAASETLLQFGRRNLGGQLGALMVLHTWDQVLKPHFHLHAWYPLAHSPITERVGHRPTRSFSSPSRPWARSSGASFSKP